MKVIICGAGQVGWQIARHLSRESNDVTVVDQDADLIRRATEVLDVQGVAGHASHPDVLERAGARDADMVIAATHSDEVNMVTCHMAHALFSVPRKIARLRASSYFQPAYADLYQRDRLPIDVVISPEREVAEAALQRLRFPTTFDTEPFLDGAAQMLGIGLEPDCPVLQTPLRQLTDLFSTLTALVVGVRREGSLFVPTPQDQLYAGDQVYVIAAKGDVGRTLEIFGKPPRRQERVVIVGGGNVGLAVARSLETGETRVRAKIIELNRAAAERAADSLERTIVLNGDGLDRAMLREANIDRADAVLCVTDDDKVNLLAGIRAKLNGCPMAICLVNDPTLLPLMAPLGIDASINPRATTVSSILKHIRHGRVRGVYSIGDAEAEVIEAVVLPTSALSGKLVREVDFPGGAMLGAILRGGRVLRPTGETKLTEGDLVLIFALAADVPEVERLLQVSIDFF